MAVGQGSIDLATYADGAAVQHVRIDHGRRDVAMTEEFLDCANVVARLQQGRREAVTQAVAPRCSRSGGRSWLGKFVIRCFSPCRRGR